MLTGDGGCAVSRKHTIWEFTGTNQEGLNRQKSKGRTEEQEWG